MIQGAFSKAIRSHMTPKAMRYRLTHTARSRMPRPVRSSSIVNLLPLGTENTTDDARFFFFIQLLQVDIGPGSARPELRVNPQIAPKPPNSVRLIDVIGKVQQCDFQPEKVSLLDGAIKDFVCAPRDVAKDLALGTFETDQIVSAVGTRAQHNIRISFTQF